MVEQFEVKPNPIEKSNSTVYTINYHIVFCPKYRKSVLMNEIKSSLELIFESILKAENMNLLEMEIMPDHVHLFVTAHPKHSPMEIVKKLKGISARLLFKQNPKFKEKEYWGGHLWSQGYYIGTAGVITKDAILKYIQSNTKLNEVKLANSSN